MNAMNPIRLRTVGALVATMSLSFAQVPTSQPEELGRVSWRRDFDAALAEAREASKPVLLLFQEVPG